MAKIVIILVHRCVKKIKGVNIWKALGNVYTPPKKKTINKK